MGDTIRAISELIDRHGWPATIAILALAFLVGLMMVHLMMLRKWAASNEAQTKVANERMIHVEQRHDTLLVSFLNQNKALVEATGTQNEKLDEIIASHKQAAVHVAEAAKETARQTELMTATAAASKQMSDLLGSDPTRICQLRNFIKTKFPEITDKELELVLQKHMEEKEKMEAKS